MKRVFSLILAAVMLLAALPALADDPDPITGVWCGDLKITDPPQVPDLAGMTHCMIFAVMEDSGTLWTGEIDFLADGTQITTGPTVSGKWEATDECYITSIVSVGEVPAYIHDGALYLQLFPGVYYKLSRMPEMNIYTDVFDASAIDYFLR